MSEESIPHYNLETVGLVSRGVGQGGSVNTMVQGLFWVARLIENIHVNRQACGPGCLCHVCYVKNGFNSKARSLP